MSPARSPDHAAHQRRVSRLPGQVVSGVRVSIPGQAVFQPLICARGRLRRVHWIERLPNCHLVATGRSAKSRPIKRSEAEVAAGLTIARDAAIVHHAAARYARSGPAEHSGAGC
jgi:hypothetical protein